MLWTLISFFIGWLAAEPPPRCSEAVLAARAAAVGEARTYLAELELGDGATEVTAEAQRRIEALKDRIATFVRSVAACGGSGMTAERMEARLAVAGAGLDQRRFDANYDIRDVHGASLSYEVRVPPGRPDLLAVVARFRINCGEDSLFFLFDRSGPPLRPLIAHRSAPYDEISGGWENLRYAVSPRSGDRRWYVVLAHTPPWCQSAWRSLRYELVRPGANADRPNVFFRQSVSNYIGNDSPLVIDAGADRLRIEHDGGILDPSIIVRRHVESYAIDGESVRRIQPAAFNVRDFVDAWLAVAWSEARMWSAGPALEQPHRTIVASLRRDGSYYEFGPIRRCGAGLHQVVLHPEAFGSALPPPRWHLVVSGGGPWRIERVSDTPAAGCRGPDLRAAIQRDSQRLMGLEPIS